MHYFISARKKQIATKQARRDKGMTITLFHYKIDVNFLKVYSWKCNKILSYKTCKHLI